MTRYRLQYRRLIAWAILVCGLNAAEPQTTTSDYDRGFASLQQGKLTEARAFLERATVAMPSSAKAWQALGLTLLQSGDYAASVRPLGRACELAPAGEDPCYLQGRTLFLLGRYEEAAGPLSKARKDARVEDRGKIDRALALNFDKLGNATEAERCFTLAISEYAPNAASREDLRLDYGAFLLRQGRAQEATKPLSQALGAHPDSVPANAELGRAQLDLDHPSEALPLLQKAVSLDPSAWNIRMLLGKAHLRLGHTEEGERELRRAREGWAAANQSSSIIQ